MESYTNIKNEHVNHMLKVLQCRISLENIHDCYKSLLGSESGRYKMSFSHRKYERVRGNKKTEHDGFSFSVTEGEDEIAHGDVNRSPTKEWDAVERCLAHNRMYSTQDDRSLFCSAIIILAFMSKTDIFRVPIFKHMTIKQVIEIFAQNIEKPFSEDMYKKEVHLIDRNGDLSSALMPWSCHITYFLNNKEYIYIDERLDNFQDFATELEDKIIKTGERHPLIKLLLKEIAEGEQNNILQTALKIKNVSFCVEQYGGHDFTYTKGSLQLNAYVSKIISGMRNDIVKKLLSYCANNESTVEDLEQELRSFARFGTIQSSHAIEYFISIGVLNQTDSSVEFSNRFYKLMYQAAYYCINYFNKANWIIDKSDKHLLYSLAKSQYVFDVIKTQKGETLISTKDVSLEAVVFGVAVVGSINYNVAFLNYLCSVATDFSVRNRQNQELAICILCIALNEYHENFSAELRNKIFQSAFSKTNYKIEQEAFAFLPHSSKYYLNEVERCYNAYLADDEAQPYYFFYYHHLSEFSEIFKNLQSLLKTDETHKFQIDDVNVNLNCIPGVAFALREISWQHINETNQYEVDNIKELLGRCFALIPSWQDAEEGSLKKYCLAAQALEYTAANLDFALSDIAEGERVNIVAQKIIGYDLLMRQKNSPYMRDYIGNGKYVEGFLVCGMFRFFSKRQQIEQFEVDNDWIRILANERGRYKVLLARTLAHTKLFEKLDKDDDDNFIILKGIADELTNADFMPYDNMDIRLVHKYSNEPLKWYTEQNNL